MNFCSCLSVSASTACSSSLACFSCSTSQQTKVRRFADVNQFYRHIYWDNSKTAIQNIWGTLHLLLQNLFWIGWIAMNLKTFNITLSTHPLLHYPFLLKYQNRKEKINYLWCFLHYTLRKLLETIERPPETILFLHRNIGNFLLEINRLIEKL